MPDREDYVATMLYAAERGAVSLDRNQGAWTLTDAKGPVGWAGLDPVTNRVARLLPGEGGTFVAIPKDVSTGKILQSELTSFAANTRSWARQEGLIVSSGLAGVGGIAVLAAAIATLVLALVNPFDMSLTAAIPGAFAVFAAPLVRRGSGTKRTAQGRELWSRIGGFHRVLSTPSSKERFNFSGRQELYTAYIPWAIALDCADEWAAKYRTEMGAEPPVPSYLGTGYAGVHTGNHVSQMLGDFSTTLDSAISSYEATQRSSSSSGGGAASPEAAAGAAAEAARGEAQQHSPINRERRSVMTAVIVIAVLVALAGFAVVGFNKLRTADVGAEEALGGIDVQLTRRADLIPNLVTTVKGYAAHEKSVFEEVTRARAGLQAAAQGDDVHAKAAADAAMQGALVSLNAVAENYPDLQANENFLDLQRQLADTENQLSFARQYYNDAVAKLNTLVRTLPWLLFTGIAGVRQREFYEAPTGHEQAPTAVESRRSSRLRDGRCATSSPSDVRRSEAPARSAPYSTNRPGSEHVQRAVLHGDPRAGGGDLGHGVLPGALAGAAHHEQVAVAHRERQRRATAAGPQGQPAGVAEGHDGDHGVLAVAPPDAVAVPGHRVATVAVEAAAGRHERLAQLVAVVLRRARRARARGTGAAAAHRRRRCARAWARRPRGRTSAAARPATARRRPSWRRPRRRRRASRGVRRPRLPGRAGCGSCSAREAASSGGESKSVPW